MLKCSKRVSFYTNPQDDVIKFTVVVVDASPAVVMLETAGACWSVCYCCKHLRPEVNFVRTGLRERKKEKRKNNNNNRNKNYQCIFIQPSSSGSTIQRVSAKDPQKRFH